MTKDKALALAATAVSITGGNPRWTVMAPTADDVEGVYEQRSYNAWPYALASASAAKARIAANLLDLDVNRANALTHAGTPWREVVEKLLAEREASS